MYREPKTSLSQTFLLLHVLGFLHIVVSQCSTKPIILNFGDSNSDTGGFASVYGVDAGFPFFLHPTGRFSDGRLIIDFLCENVNASYLTPFLDSLEPKFENGVNFAIGGAATQPRNVLVNLNIQVLQFTRFRKRNLERKSNGLSYWMGEEDFVRALYTIDIGQNDLSHAFGFLSYHQAIGNIPSYVSEIRSVIWDIYMLGGRKFWVHSTGPLGCLPQEVLRRQNVSDVHFDKYGCIKSLNDGAKLFNAKLNVACQELRSLMENSTIVYVDLYSIKYDLIANSSSYGFKNPLRSCCEDGDAHDKNSSHRKCLNGRGCISWDGTHYTEAANAIIATKILSTRYSTPPLEFKLFTSTI